MTYQSDYETIESLKTLNWTVRSSQAVGKVKKNGHACAREGRHVRDWLK